MDNKFQNLTLFFDMSFAYNYMQLRVLLEKSYRFDNHNQGMIKAYVDYKIQIVSVECSLKKIMILINSKHSLSNVDKI